MDLQWHSSKSPEFETFDGITNFLMMNNRQLQPPSAGDFPPIVQSSNAPIQSAGIVASPPSTTVGPFSGGVGNNANQFDILQHQNTVSGINQQMRPRYYHLMGQLQRGREAMAISHHSGGISPHPHLHQHQHVAPNQSTFVTNYGPTEAQEPAVLFTMSTTPSTEQGPSANCPPAMQNWAMKDAIPFSRAPAANSLMPHYHQRRDHDNQHNSRSSWISAVHHPRHTIRKQSMASSSSEPILPSSSSRSSLTPLNNTSIMNKTSIQHRPSASSSIYPLSIHSAPDESSTMVRANGVSSSSTAFCRRSRPRSSSATALAESERSRLRRQKETPSQREKRLKTDRERMRRRRAEEDNMLREALAGLCEDSENVAKTILETRRRRKEMAKRRLENESDEQRMRRLKRQREHKQRRASQIKKSKTCNSQ